MARTPFPQDFWFGAGNSDSQCEAFEAAFADIRDAWYARRGQTPRGRATDFWNRFREDITLAQGLGCRMFRFSIAWARVEPSPGVFNAQALDHYSDVVDAVRAAGMEPLVTLMHFTWPLHIEERGGLIADGFPDLFVSYAQRVVARLGARVKYWCTVNEPNILCFGYIKPWWEQNYFAPPGLPPEAGLEEQIQAQMALIRNLFLAHARARAMIKRDFPAALVGANPALLGLPSWLQTFMDNNVIHLRSPDHVVKKERRLAEKPVFEKGKVDVIIAMFTRTAERSTELDFSDTYFVAHQRMFVLATSAAQSSNDLAGGVIAVVASSTAETTVRLLFPQAKALAVVDHAEGLRQLDAGTAGGFVSDDVWIAGTMQANPGRYRVLPGNLSDEAYAVAVPKGNPGLPKAVNSAVKEFLISGRWAEGYQKNFGQPAPAPPADPATVTLSDIGQEKLGDAARVATPQGPKDQPLPKRMLAQKKIRVGVKVNVPGLAFRDLTTGAWSGLEIDLARFLAWRLFGSEDAVEFVQVATRQRTPYLRSTSSWFDPLFKLWALLNTSLTTNWWHLGMAGKLQPFLCPAECVGQLDYVGMDYYWGCGTFDIMRFIHLVEALAGGRFEVAPVFEGGLYNGLAKVKNWFPNLPVIVVENGCVKIADEMDCAAYLKKHLGQVQKALDHGVNVRAWLCWSITSNRELGHPFAPNTDFGLYHIDLDTDPALTRSPTAAGQLVRQVAQTGIIPE